MPFYDFTCPGCGSTRELRRSMDDAGAPAPCPDCGEAMRRVFSTETLVIMRPWGYNLKPDDPKYWDGFDAPVPTPLAWQRGRGQKASPGPEYVGTGIVHKS